MAAPARLAARRLARGRAAATLQSSLAARQRLAPVATHLEQQTLQAAAHQQHQQHQQLQLQQQQEQLLEAAAAQAQAWLEPAPVGPPKPVRLETADLADPRTYAATTMPPHEAFTIHPDAYSSERFFQTEKEKVFGNSWVCVGMADELRQPGDTITGEIGGQPIFIVRDKKGDLNGFLNVCRHRGSKLVRKNGRYPVISCPYHRWGYALDGRLLATPLWDTTEGGMRFDKKTGEHKAPRRKKAVAEETTHTHMQRVTEYDHEAVAAIEAAERHAEAQGKAQEAKNLAGGSCAQLDSIRAAYSTEHIKAFNKDDFGLFNVRVASWGPFIFATLAPEEKVPSLYQILGDACLDLSNYPLHELVSVRKKTYHSKANWKLLADNFMEYYHLPTVHPALTTVSGVDNHHRKQGAGQYIGFVTNPLTKGGQPIDPGTLPVMPGLKDDEEQTGVFHHLFPNVFYFLLPSHMFCVRLDPMDATNTIEHADLLVHPSLLDDAKVKEETAELNAKIDAIMGFYDMTNMEDIHACELVQEGIKAKNYDGGRVSFRFEETIHRFQNMLIDHMVGYPGRIPKGDADIPFYIGGKTDLDARDQLVQQPGELQ